MNIAGYMYLIRGEEYKFPYQECVKSVLPFCESVHVLTDPRFADTKSVIEKLEAISSKVIVHVEELELDNPGIDGISKARARELASKSGADWLIQMDADEIFRNCDIPKIKPLLLEAEEDIISCGQINWFNGNHIKTDAPISKERFSRNVKYITHGIPVQYRQERDDGLFYVEPDAPTDGAGYINMGGNSLSGGNTTPMDKAKIFISIGDTFKLFGKEHNLNIYVSNDFVTSLKNDIWVPHYSWYSIPHRWLREKTWHYFWGILRGKYENLQDYETADGKNIDFFVPSKLRTPRAYYEPITNEMHSNKIAYCSWIEHPKAMDEWREKVTPYLYGKKKTILCKPRFSIMNLFTKSTQPIFD